MKRIASPQDLQFELRSLMAFVHGHGPGGKPDRHIVASKLRELADRVAGEKTAASLHNLRVYPNDTEATAEVKEALSDVSIDLMKARDKYLNAAGRAVYKAQSVLGKHGIWNDSAIQSDWQKLRQIPDNFEEVLQRLAATTAKLLNP